jgi:hypothetical protein
VDIDTDEIQADKKSPQNIPAQSRDIPAQSRDPKPWRCRNDTTTVWARDNFFLTVKFS